MFLVQNWQFFHLLIFGKKRQENVFYGILKEKTPLWSVKTGNSKSRRSAIFPVVLVKNYQFFHLFILGKKCRKNVFYGILERKNALLDYKNRKFKKSKNWDFSNGVSPRFWSKIGNFSIFLS